VDGRFLFECDAGYSETNVDVVSGIAVPLRENGEAYAGYIE
jgi:hypothetical protein